MGNIGNKNTMLPTYNATYENMNKALNDGTISSPCWVFLEDKNALVFVHFDTVNGERKLVPHIILWDKITNIEAQLEGLVDPETKEPIKVTEYVQDTVLPVQQQVDTVTTEVIEVKEKVGYVSMLVSGEETE